MYVTCDQSIVQSLPYTHPKLEIFPHFIYSSLWYRLFVGRQFSNTFKVCFHKAPKLKDDKLSLPELYSDFCAFRTYISHLQIGFRNEPFDEFRAHLR